MGRSEARRRAALLAALCAAALVCALSAPGAGAVVVVNSGHGYGVNLRPGVSPASVPGVSRAARALAGEAGGNLKYLGGPVMAATHTHVIFWDPNKEFTPEAKQIVEAFFSDVAHDSGLATNVFGVDAQYTDAGGQNAAYSSTYEGALEDTNAYPSKANQCAVPPEVDLGPPYTACIYDSQLQSQLQTFVASRSLPRGFPQLYFVLLPHKVVTCFDESEICSNNFYCAYHSYIEPKSPAKRIVYADIPFSLLDEELAKGCQADNHAQIQAPNGDTGGTGATTRFADVAVKYISHEFSESITDPLVEYETAWVDGNGEEVGDKCNFFGAASEPGANPKAFLPVLGGTAAAGTLYDQSIDGGHYYLQSEWDNATEKCLMAPAPISSAAFTFSPASPEDPVTFKGGASDPYGHPVYSWQFGDGTTGSGAAPTHTYKAHGTYTATMTVEDALTHATASVEHPVSVAGATVITKPATGETELTATLNASANPNGEEVTSCRFEWGTSASYGKTAECTPAKPSGSAPVTVSASIAGLLPNTIYHFAIALETAGGHLSTGKDVAFTTIPEPPQAEARPAGPVGQTYATLNGEADPMGATVEKCEFVYFVAGKLVNHAPCAAAPGRVNAMAPVSATVSGLVPGTQYEYILLLETRGGLAESDLQAIFTTLALTAPQAALGSPSAIGSSTATLTGSVDPKGGETTCVFEYGSSAAYGSSAQCSPQPGEGLAVVGVSAALAALAPSSTYHYRLAATGAGTTVYTADATFTTGASAAPPSAVLPGALTASPFPVPALALARRTVSAATGAVTFTVSVNRPGMLSWVLAFQNGKFGVFAASAGAKCRSGQVRLQRRCRPASIDFATGRMSVAAAGSFSFVAKPGALARKALEAARRRHGALPVTAKVTFTAAGGAESAARTAALAVRLKKR